MKKNILIVNVAAESGGSLKILEEYYEKAVSDIYNNYIFILSKPNFKNTKNIRVINIKWIKKSWFHRLFFDNFTIKKIVKKEKPSEIISLQNTYIKNKKRIFQTIYMHQSIPFTNIKFSIIRETKLWIYQNIIGRIIKKSVKKADKVIVQTEWIKQAIVKQTNINENKVFIEKPEIRIGLDVKSELDKNPYIFFYPATSEKYKNHDVIISAIKNLKSEGVTNFNVYLTLTGKENINSKKISKQIIKHDLPIKLIGKLNYDSMIDMYSRSILIFPSYLETFGLPLAEARKIGSPIISSNTLFSREVLENYKNVRYFEFDDVSKLTEIIGSIMKNTEGFDNFVT